MVQLRSRVITRTVDGLRRRGFVRSITDDVPSEWLATIRRTEPYTVVSTERTVGLISAIEYVCHANIPGAFVECGVWRGGSSMAAAETLLRLGDRRELWLYDTFEGMVRPGELDVSYLGERELDKWSDDMGRQDIGGTGVCEVHSALASTGYDMELVRFVKGPVEETVPAATPDQIAVLRLDTDWYESTRHELEHLYPRLSPGGVLIVDDYGHYVGARKAVDDYFADAPVYLARLDYSGRVVVKR